MNVFENAKAELLAELEVAKAIDTTDLIERKVAEYKAELEATAEADKQAIVNEKMRDLEAIERIIAKEIAKAEALALAEAEEEQVGIVEPLPEEPIV